MFKVGDEVIVINMETDSASFCEKYSNQLGIITDINKSIVDYPITVYFKHIDSKFPLNEKELILNNEVAQILYTKELK